MVSLKEIQGVMTDKNKYGKTVVLYACVIFYICHKVPESERDRNRFD